MSHSRSVIAACAILFLAVAAAAKSPNAGSKPWSFSPLKKPALPLVENGGWARDDLDRFVLARLDAARLKPNADADRTVLLRRLTFDLTGLPPSDGQITAFLHDSGDDDQALAQRRRRPAGFAAVR